jgi:hypothetical protein
MLLEAGALGHVVPLLLRYDATLGPELLQEHVQPFTSAGPAPILQVRPCCWYLPLPSTSVPPLSPHLWALCYG